MGDKGPIRYDTHNAARRFLERAMLAHPDIKFYGVWGTAKYYTIGIKSTDKSSDEETLHRLGTWIKPNHPITFAFSIHIGSPPSGVSSASATCFEVADVGYFIQKKAINILIGAARRFPTKKPPKTPPTATSTAREVGTLKASRSKTEDMAVSQTMKIR